MKAAAYLSYLMMPAMTLFAAPGSSPNWIKLDFPKAEQAVGLRACFAGRLNDPNAHVVLIIKPLEISSYFVQPNVEVRSNGSFFVVGYVGEPGREFTGKHFVARAYVNPRQPLREGDQLDDWPDAFDARSELLEFTRSANDRTNCPGDAVSLLSPQKTVTLGYSVSSQSGNVHAAEVDSTSDDRAADHPQRGPSYGTKFRWIWWVLCALLAMFATLPEKVQEATDSLKRGILALWASLTAAFFRAKRSVDACNKRTPGSTLVAWNQARVAIADKRYGRHAIRLPILAPCFLLTCYAEALAIAPGLKLLYPPRVSDLDLFGGSVVNALSPASWHVPAILAFLLNPFLALWNDEPWALALTVIQTAVGCCILEALESSALSLSPKALLKARPIAFPAFMLFDLGLGMIAFNRGYELTIAGHWQVPALVAGMLGFAMPWATTFTLHAMIESLNEVTFPIRALFETGVLYIGYTVPAIWVRLWGSLWLLPAAVVLLTLAAVCGLFWLYVQAAGLIGAVCAKIYRALHMTRRAEQSSFDWVRRPESSFGD